VSRSRRAEGSVTLKRGLWYAILTIGHDSRGKQLRHWSNGYKTRRQAERALAQLLIDERRSKETPHTVRRVVSAYIKHDVTPRGKRSPTTTQRYWGLLANMKPLHEERVDRLSGPILDRLFSELLEKGLSHTTVHHVYNLMFAAFAWAKSKRVGLITRNPFETDDVERIRRATSPARALTTEQAQQALEYIAATKHANALLFSLATACRRGETCGLKWDSIDWQRKIAVIREARYQVSGEQGQKSAKADRVREIPLNETAVRALIAERDRQRCRMDDAGEAWINSGHVFTDELGAPLSPMALTNAFGRCARAAGLPTRRMHDLRHTAATFILSGGSSAVAASKILGHSEESTTLRLYGHVIGQDEARASRQIDKALSRHLSRRHAKVVQKTEQNVVAPTGIEPVFPP